MPDLEEIWVGEWTSEYKVDTVSKLFDIIKILTDLGGDKQPFLFRGIRDPRYKLIPNLLRDDFITKEKITTNAEVCIYETKKLIQFFHQCDQRGLKVPDIDTFRRLSTCTTFSLDDILSASDKNLYYWLPDAVLDIAALAQHYGLPTRMLDWTRDFFTAVWFALRGLEEKDVPKVIWAINAKWLQDFKRWQRAECYEMGIGAYDTPEITGVSIADSEKSSDGGVIGNPIVKAGLVSGLIPKDLFLEVYDDSLPLIFYVPPYHDNPNLCAQNGVLSLWQWNLLSQSYTNEMARKDLVEAKSLQSFNDGINAARDQFMFRPIDKSPLETLLSAYLDEHKDEVEKFGKERYPRQGRVLYRIELSPAILQELRSILEFLGYNKSTLFPGYQEAAETVSFWD